MTNNKNPKFEDFLELYDKLNDQGKRDVLDIAHYHTWRSTGKAKFKRRAIRGAWLNFWHKVEKLFTQGTP